MVHRKTSSKTIASVKVLPSKGRLQLLWSREYSLAENSCEVTSHQLSVQDRDINKWFTEGSEDQISYCSNEVSNPCDDGGIEVFEERIPLTVRSWYKFEVPALCMQWEGMLCGSAEEPCLLPEVVSICQQWSDVNTGGRIFVICDNTIGTSGQHQQEKAKHRQVIQSLVKQFSSCPVYMFCIESPADSGGFTKPPNPGILAFLQRRHLLNIHTKDSVYLYQSQVHKVMAVTAGMPHLKMSRAVHQPSLVASSHVYSIPNIPPYLKDLDILPPEDLEQKTPEIPGFCEISSFQDNEISMHLGFGRREFLFAEDIDTVTKFNKIYSEMASLVTDTVSKFSKANPMNELEADVDGEKLPAKKLCMSRSLSDRELPCWMMSERKTKLISQSKSPKPSTSRTDSTDSTNSKYKRTEYVMTEVELAEIAEDILKQAGREDLIRSIQSQQIQESVIKKHDESTAKKQTEKKGAKQSFVSSMDVDDEEDDDDNESSVDVPSLRCDIAPEVAKVNLTGPALCGVPSRDVVSSWDIDQAPNTSLLDDFLISEDVRKRSPKKPLRKSQNTPTKKVKQSGYVHFCENSDLQRTSLFQKKLKKLTTKPDISSNRSNSKCESPPIDEHLLDSSADIQEKTEITGDHFTEISERKLPDFSLLDEIFS